MKQLNFNHLQYFYTVAKEGSVTRAAEVLNVTPQTVSGQLATFEAYLGAPLFQRHGKRLEPNSLGKITLGYADDIFNLGNELSKTLASHNPGQAENFCVGIVDALPKVMVFDILNHCFDVSKDCVLECHEGELSDLLIDLSTNKLDLIISDQPLPTNVNVRAVSHFLGESGLTFFAEKEQAALYKDNFPMSLDAAPFLMPSKKSAQNQSLIAWFVKNKVKPRITAEFDDTALLKFFGQAGRGIFCVSSSIEHDILEQFNVDVVGRAHEVTDRYYAIVPKRRIKHSAVDTVLKYATDLFNEKKPKPDNNPDNNNEMG